MPLVDRKVLGNDGLRAERESEHCLRGGEYEATEAAGDRCLERIERAHRVEPEDDVVGGQPWLAQGSQMHDGITARECGRKRGQVLDVGTVECGQVDPLRLPQIDTYHLVPGPARLEDDAAAAGVSISTASRALREHPAVREATRRKVRTAANRLGYEPNRMASALRTRISSFVGIVVPDITIPFFGLVVKAAQDVLEAAGYQVLVMNTHRDADQERQALRTLLSHRAGGVMVATYGGHDRGLRIPLVFFANVDEEAQAPRV